MRKTIIASVALLALTSSAFANGLNRCQDTSPRQEITAGSPITEQRDVTEQRTREVMTSSSQNPGNGFPVRCQLQSGVWSISHSIDQFGFCGPAESIADTGTGTYATQSFAVKVGEETVIVGQEPDIITNIDQYQTGKVDLKDSAKAYLDAVKDAIRNRDPIPKPGPQFEVVDWNPPSDGSC